MPAIALGQPLGLGPLAEPDQRLDEVADQVGAEVARQPDAAGELEPCPAASAASRWRPRALEDVGEVDVAAQRRLVVAGLERQPQALAQRGLALRRVAQVAQRRRPA